MSKPTSVDNLVNTMLALYKRHTHSFSCGVYTVFSEINIKKKFEWNLVVKDNRLDRRLFLPTYRGEFEMLENGCRSKFVTNMLFDSEIAAMIHHDLYFELTLVNDIVMLNCRFPTLNYVPIFKPNVWKPCDYSSIPQLHGEFKVNEHILRHALCAEASDFFGDQKSSFTDSKILLCGGNRLKILRINDKTAFIEWIRIGMSEIPSVRLPACSYSFHCIDSMEEMDLEQLEFYKSQSFCKEDDKKLDDLKKRI